MNNPSVKIDGEWRDLYVPYAKVEGEWHPGNIYTKIDGEWICTYKYSLDPSDIAEFRLIYARAKYKRHPQHPQLVDNPEVPHIMSLTGEHIGISDTTEKGVIFEYTNDLPDTEGICAYEAHMYVVTKSGLMIDVCTDGIYPQTPNGNEFGSDRIKHLDITITGIISYQTFGYYMAGWNSLFNHNEHIDYTVYPDKGPHEKSTGISGYHLLTPEHRESSFTSVASIGIARDMSTPVTNMVGNHGKLSQSITDVIVNGNSFPFVIEIQK